MNIIILTPPPFEPVTLQECYTHLRLDPDGSPPEHPDDAMLRRHIATARGQAEKMTRRAFVQQTIRLVTDRFPSEGRSCWIELLRPPLIAVQQVTYHDENNSLQSVDSGNYFTTDDFVPRLQFIDGFTLPCTYRRDDAVRVDYAVGYDPEGSPATTQAEYAGNVPGEIKDAILLGVQLLYDQLSPEQREQLERARDSLLEGFRVHSR